MRRYHFIFAVGLLLISAKTADADQLRVFAGGALRPIIDKASTTFENQTGHKILTKFGEPGALKRDIDAGAPFDVIVLDRAVIDVLIAGGKIDSKSRKEIARVGMAFAMRQGGANPKVDSVDAFKRMLLAANSISYAPEGATGMHLRKVFEQLGISNEMKAKAKLQPTAASVGQAVAEGQVEVAFSLSNNLSANPKLQVMGLLPDELQYWVVFTTGISSTTQFPTAAASFVEKLSAPEIAPLLSRQGLQPVLAK